MTDNYAVAADELRQFIERLEHLADEKRKIADQTKEVMAEAKGRGYDTKAIRAILTLRRMRPDDRAEQEAVIEIYANALGMN